MAEAITVGVREFRENLSRYLAEVRNGAEIAITSHGKTVAEVKAPAKKTVRPVPTFGALKGKMWIADDFDDPMPEFEKAYWGDD